MPEILIIRFERKNPVNDNQTDLGSEYKRMEEKD